MKKKTEKTERLVAKATTFAAVKVGLRKNSSLSTGSGTRRSMRTKATTRTAARTNSPSIHHVP